MPYRVSPDGTIECDTAQEAVELQSLIGAKEPRRQAPRTSRQAESTDRAQTPDFAGFWGELNKIGKMILGILDRESSPISSQLLAEKCKITTKDLPSKMIHVRRTAKRRGISEPVVRVSAIIGKKATGTYQISEETRQRLTDQLTKWRDAQK